MLTFLKEYFSYLDKYVYTKIWMWLVFVIFPGVFTVGIFLFFDCKEIANFLKDSSQEIINFFALTSGFLFTGISLIISTNNLSKKDKEKLELKNALLYDIIFQFGLTIFVVLMLTIVNSISIGIIAMVLSGFISYFSMILGFSIFRLLKNFFFFQKMVS